MTTNTSTALTTGGTSGIGCATANKLAQLGTHVLVWGAMRSAERRQSTNSCSGRQSGFYFVWSTRYSERTRRGE